MVGSRVGLLLFHRVVNIIEKNERQRRNWERERESGRRLWRLHANQRTEHKKRNCFIHRSFNKLAAGETNSTTDFFSFLFFKQIIKSRETTRRLLCHWLLRAPRQDSITDMIPSLDWLEFLDLFSNLDLRERSFFSVDCLVDLECPRRRLCFIVLCARFLRRDHSSSLPSTSQVKNPRLTKRHVSRCGPSDCRCSNTVEQRCERRLLPEETGQTQSVACRSTARSFGVDVRCCLDTFSMRSEDQSVHRRWFRLLLSGNVVFEQRWLLFADVLQEDLLLITPRLWSTRLAFYFVVNQWVVSKKTTERMSLVFTIEAREFLLSIVLSLSRLPKIITLERVLIQHGRNEMPRMYGVVFSSSPLRGPSISIRLESNQSNVFDHCPINQLENRRPVDELVQQSDSPPERCLCDLFQTTSP